MSEQRGAWVRVCALIKQMALAGSSCEEISVQVRARQQDVREYVEEVLELSFLAPDTTETCSKCGKQRHSIDKRTGWCRACVLSDRNDRRRYENHEEEMRLIAEEEDKADTLKQQLKRMREKHGANPRKD